MNTDGLRAVLVNDLDGSLLNVPVTNHPQGCSLVCNALHHWGDDSWGFTERRIPKAQLVDPANGNRLPTSAILSAYGKT